VTEVSKRMSVLNFGRKIADGVPREIMTNKDVVDAYLGTELTEVAAS